MKIEVDKKQSMTILKRLYCFSGRATRKEFWLTVLCLFVVGVVAGAVGGALDAIGLDFIAVPLVSLLIIAVLVASVANVFRRVHDLGLSGFWMFYLSFFGLPCLYVAYVMDADESAKQVVLRIKDVGTPWLGWILAVIFWPMGSFFGLLIILLSPGQNSDNKYGTNPYLKEMATEAVSDGV